MLVIYFATVVRGFFDIVILNIIIFVKVRIDFGNIK